MAEEQEKISFCCEAPVLESIDKEDEAQKKAAAEEASKNSTGIVQPEPAKVIFTCTRCKRKCKLQPREWRWWEEEVTDEEGNVSYKPTMKVTLLKKAFEIGASDKEACVYAEISLNQLYYYQKLFPKFSSEKELLKEKPVLAARQTVIKAIQGFNMEVLDKQGNLVEIQIKPNEDLAMRYLERRADELKPKLDISSNVSISERDYVLEEALKKATPEQREILLNAIAEIHEGAGV